MAEDQEKYTEQPDEGLKYIYPNESAPDHVKDSRAYGLTVAEYINRHHISNNSFYDRRDEFLKVRTHMKGEVDVSDFADMAGVDQDASSLAINWKPIRLLSKYINIAADSLQDDIYRVKAKGIDEISNRDRLLHSKRLEEAMMLRPFNRQFNQLFSRDAGVQFGMPEEQLPETREELELLKTLTGKQKREIASEMSIRKVLKYNRYNEEMRHQLNEYMCEHGEGGFRLSVQGGRLDIRQVDPINMIFPRDISNSRSKKNTPYVAEIVDMTLGQVIKIANEHGVAFTQDDIEYLAAHSGRTNTQGTETYESNGRANCSINDYDSEIVLTVLDFAYKTTNHLTRKKSVSTRNGSVTLKRKDQDWEPGNSRYVSKIQKPYDVWYEGLYVVGMGKLITYSKFQDMPRMKNSPAKTYGPYVYYELSSESLGNKILPYVEQCYITYIKIQQLVQKMRPKGIHIDTNRLADIIVAGQTLDANDIIARYNEEGVLLWTSKTEEDGRSGQMPVGDLPGDDGMALRAAFEVYNQWINKIREDTGLNEVRDATSPNPEMPVGTNQQAFQQSLNATAHIRRGVLNVYRELCETILAHVQHMVRCGYDSRMLREMIGEFPYDVFEAFKHLHENEFDLEIELKLTQEQRAKISQFIDSAVKTQQITLPEAAEIEMTENYSVALALLKIKIAKREKQKQEQERMMAEQQGAIEQAKVQAEMQKQQQLYDLELRNQQQKLIGEIERDLAIERGKAEIQQQYGTGKVPEQNAIEDHKSELRKQEQQLKDENKQDLAAQQASQNSKMIDQRSKDSQPVDFEGENVVKKITQ